MANPEHVAIAKRRTFAINRWRAQFFQRRERLNLSGAYLSGIRMPGVDLAYDDLSEIDLTTADLRNGNFAGASLRQAHLSRCNLNRAVFTDAQAAGVSFIRSNLRGCNLDNADLRGADLSNCDAAFATLVGANLSGANLTETDLTMADLTDANLSGARLGSAGLDVANLTRCDLRRASLIRTRLDRALLQDCVVDMTLFGDCDLSSALALETVRHDGPSIVGADTLARSGAGLPELFLRSAGVPDDFINGRLQLPASAPEYRRILLIGSVLDCTIVDWLETELRQRGLQCWSLLADDEATVYNTQVFPPMSRFRNFDRVALLCSRAALESAYCWRLYNDIYQRQTSSDARRVYLVSVAMDDCLTDADDNLRQFLRRSRLTTLRPRKDRKGAYRRDVPHLMATLTAAPVRLDDGPVDDDALVQ